MVQEVEPIPFIEWLSQEWPSFALRGFILAVIALVLSYLVMAFRYGPLAAGDIIYRFLKTAIVELLQFSPRRTIALARLAVQESIRRRVLASFAVFILILMFAVWFLDPSSRDPGALYLSFVLTATNYLVLAMVLFLSAFSLPNDMKTKTIYTVVTKPVRSGEIVLGRILGFALVGTALLAVMGVFSYVFVVRALHHTHEVEGASLGSGKGDSHVGETTFANSHKHSFSVDAAGNGATEISQGHWHAVTAETPGDPSTYVVGPPQGLLVARVPLTGRLSFTDRVGRPLDKGINVGDEWGYRSYVEGATQASTIWTFSDITPERFPPEKFADGLPLEMTIQVFRSHKGQIDKGVSGTIQFRNPRDKKKRSELEFFQAKDNGIDQRLIPLTPLDASGRELDLFKDLAPDGELEVIIRCEDDGQYFGVARADMYIRAADNPFLLNFIKGFLGIWMQMLLVTCFGTMFSTFLSGPVAMLATLSTIVLGFFTSFVVDLASGALVGGGPFESALRLYTQENVTIELENTLDVRVVRAIDQGLVPMLRAVSDLVPDYRQFSSFDLLAHGFDISVDSLMVQGVKTLAYVLVVLCVGYFFLKTREVAR